MKGVESHEDLNMSTMSLHVLHVEASRCFSFLHFGNQ